MSRSPSLPWLFGAAGLALFAAHGLVATARIRRLRAEQARRASEPASPPDAEPPEVSVVRPVHGGGEAALAGVESWLELEEAEGVEFVLAFQAPDDPLLEALPAIRRRHPGRLVRTVVAPVEPGYTGKGSNLLHGVAAARGRLLVLADADMVASPGLLRALLEPLATPCSGVAAVSAVPLHRGARGLWGLLYQTHMNATVLAEWLPWAGLVDAGAPGAAVALRRETLEAIGGVPAFGRHVNDDVRLGQLLRRTDGRLRLASLPVSPVGAKSRRQLESLLARGALIFRRMLPPPLQAVHHLVHYAYLPMALMGVRDRRWLGGAGLYLLGKMALSAWVARLAGARPLSAALAVPLLDATMLLVEARTLRDGRLSWGGIEYRADAGGRLRSLAGDTPPLYVQRTGRPAQG
ncbi:MAG: glycosyltransferase [Clostridia bacterium]|nr:glycosyltransferase [Clostridia bacterium]